MVILGISRQGGGRRLSLSATKTHLKQFAWFVALWAASVITIGIVAYFIRFWLGLA